MIERIKFRAKWLLSFGDVKENDWVHAGIGEEYSLRGFFADLDRKRLDPTTVGQWTGLTDCDGTEIYEGDIVEYNIGCSDSDNPSGVIDFQIGQFFIEREGNLLTIDDTTDIQVIGTIHDKAAG